MESWVVGFEGDEDVERHAAAGDSDSPLPRTGDGSPPKEEGPGERALRIRAISDYI